MRLQEQQRWHPKKMRAEEIESNAFEMSTWSMNPQFYLAFIVHATLIMGRQLKAYDDCGHKLHMVGANNAATENDRARRMKPREQERKGGLHTSWYFLYWCLSVESLVAATGKNDRCMLQNTVHCIQSTQLFTKPFCSFRCTIFFLARRVWARVLSRLPRPTMFTGEWFLNKDKICRYLWSLWLRHI